MGLTASIFQISAAEYEAGRNGDLDNLGPHVATSFNLDKAWHAIHYLLTGDSTLTFLLSGTQVAGTSEHCEVHAPASIAALHRRLSETSAGGIMAGFDPATFARLEIYPNAGWSSEAASYIQPYLEMFLSEVKQAADRDLGFLVVID